MVLISIIVSVSSMYKSHLYPSIEISLRILSLFPRNANLRLLIEEAIILFASARLSRTTPLVVHPSYFLNQIGIDSSDPFIRCRYDFSLGGSNRYCMTDAKRSEQQANRFSSAILMPRCSVKILLARTPNRGQRNWSSLAVEKLVNTFNVSADAALYRLKELGYIDGNC